MIKMKRMIVIISVIASAYIQFSSAATIGYFPGLDKLIESADAIVVLIVEKPLSDFKSPTGYAPYKCFIKESLKGDLKPYSPITLQLYEFGSDTASPYTRGSTHLMFLVKRTSENEPTDYKTAPIEGSQIRLSSFR